MIETDIVVLGTGFAGSLFAMVARQLGFSVTLLERGTHPRFAIGESTTPLTNLLLEQLSKRYGLHRVLPLAKWGSWQRSYPDLRCGLKRGFSFFFEQLGGKEPCRAEQALLFAASPHDAIADTHWLRADVDHFLLREAERCGAESLDRAELLSFDEQADDVELRVRQGEQILELRAGFVVDATGPRGALYTMLRLGECALPSMPRTHALYTHFAGVAPLAQPPGAPYPVDQAAVHYLFDGGWAWVLRFGGGRASVGVVADTRQGLGLEQGEPAWHVLMEKLPALAAQLRVAHAVERWCYAPRMSFRAGKITGSRWAMLPSAAGFVDPLLSSGFPLALLGVERLAQTLQAHWQSETLAPALASYAAQTDGELLATSELVGAMYANFARSRVFHALSLIYFAAATFAESARRLGRPERARGFLLCEQPEFQTAVLPLLRRAGAGVADESAFLVEVCRALEPFDVAGLSRARSPQWYPVEAEDLLAHAGKLGASREEAGAMLRRSGFAG